MKLILREGTTTPEREIEGENKHKHDCLKAHICSIDVDVSDIQISSENKSKLHIRFEPSNNFGIAHCGKSRLNSF